MADREAFTISELEARTGVPRSTIHGYARKGMLPPPHRDAVNRFLYDDRHERAVRLIRLLRTRRGMSIRQIRHVLPDLLGHDDEEAFRPQMWDRAIERYTRSHADQLPGKRLLHHAADLFASQGYGETNVDEICKAAGVAKGSLYRHHQSKAELFFAVADHISDELEAALASGAPGALSTEAAVAVVTEVLGPRVPIVLDLVSGALQRRPGYQQVAARILDRIVRSIQRRLASTSQDAARQVIGAATLKVTLAALRGEGPDTALPSA